VAYAGDMKIDNMYLTVFVNQDVPRLEVIMDNVSFMKSARSYIYLLPKW
jgi:hypothetical protein